jgi:hypothetical protein
VDGIVPIDAVTVSDVRRIASGTGSAYTGTLTNELDREVNSPGVMVFPVNRVGRPLGVASSEAATEIEPGGSWTFETDSVEDPGVEFAAFPSLVTPL